MMARAHRDKEEVTAHGTQVFYTHGVLVVILLLGFVMRLFLADWKSYWLDEMLSAVVYGSKHPSPFAAINLLAERSVHPPLYQFILYCWMALFGDSELATRTLSNLYVAGATLWIYILAFRLYGLRVAIAAALVFSLMYLPIYYGLETRSYAQTLFLSSLSSLLLYRFLCSLPQPLRWRPLMRNGWLLALIGVNFALLLTHYYNAFFLAVQAIFLLAYLPFVNRADHIISAAIKAIVISATPLLLFIATWGPVVATTYVKKGRPGSGVGPGVGPLSRFFEMVLVPNFSYPALALLVIGALLLPRLVKDSRSFRGSSNALPALFDFYFLAATVLPFVLIYVFCMIANHDTPYRYRYFIFAVPPLTVLVALSLDEAVRLLEQLASRFGRDVTAYATALVLFAAALAVLPGGYRAAMAVKVGDTRGIARDIAALVSEQPESRYIIYEANYFPSLDHYFAKLKHGPRVRDVITKRAERSGALVFETQSDEIRAHDYLVVAFTHFGTKRVAKSAKKLLELYDLEHSVMNEGHGFMIFRTKPPEKVF